MTPRGPFPELLPFAASRRERVLRGYLAAFGLSSPARLEPDRPRSDPQLAEALRRMVQESPQTSVVYVWSPPPDAATRPEIERALMAHPRRRVDLRWVSMLHGPSIPRAPGVVATAVAEALGVRARVAEERGERALRQLGIRVERVRPRPVPVEDRP